MYTNGKLKQKDGNWEIEVSYDMPFNGKKFDMILEHQDKIKVMELFFVNIGTLLSIRLDEFHSIVINEIAPKFQKTSEHYRIKIDSKNWLPKYWRFREEINQLKEFKHVNHIFCDKIIQSQFVFKMILPEYEILAGYKVKLINIYDEIMKLAKAVKATELKVHEEYRLTF